MERSHYLQAFDNGIWYSRWDYNVLVMQRRLQWLDHVGRMSNDCLPKQLLFEEFLTARPVHGPKLWWRESDVVLEDIKRMGFDVSVQHRITLGGLMLARLSYQGVSCQLVALL